jgi:hydroxymethylpyrimidine/phosphomethylpyrimidine kinase
MVDASVDRVGIGVAAGSLTGKLHIDQYEDTGAEPVIVLDQADVSEEFVRMIGQAAAATLTQSLVNEADVTTPTRVGWFKVYVQDDGNQITDGAYYVPFYTLA